MSASCIRDMVVNRFLSALSLALSSRLKRRQNIVVVKNQTDLLPVIVFDEKTGDVFASLDPI